MESTQTDGVSRLQWPPHTSDRPFGLLRQVWHVHESLSEPCPDRRRARRTRERPPISTQARSSLLEWSCDGAARACSPLGSIARSCDARGCLFLCFPDCRSTGLAFASPGTAGLAFYVGSFCGSEIPFSCNSAGCESRGWVSFLWIGFPPPPLPTRFVRVWGGGDLLEEAAAMGKPNRWYSGQREQQR